MGIIKDKKKFKRTKKQTHPTNPSGLLFHPTKPFNIDAENIKKQQTKK